MQKFFKENEFTTDKTALGWSIIWLSDLFLHFSDCWYSLFYFRVQYKIRLKQRKQIPHIFSFAAYNTNCIPVFFLFSSILKSRVCWFQEIIPELFCKHCAEYILREKAREKNNSNKPTNLQRICLAARYISSCKRLYVSFNLK